MRGLVPETIAPARLLSEAPSEVAVAVFVGRMDAGAQRGDRSLDLVTRVAAIRAVRSAGGPIGVVVHA